MTRIVTASLALLLLSACANDYALRLAPPPGDEETAPGPPAPTWPDPPEVNTDPPPPLDPPDPPDPPEGGGSPWGNLNPGELPEVYFAVAYQQWTCDDVDGDGADPGEDEVDVDEDADDDADGDGIGDEDPPEEGDEEPPSESDDWWGGCPTKLAVIDLMGQVIAEFPLPAETEDWTPWSHLALSSAGPGQFLAVLEDWGPSDEVGDGDDADGDAFWIGNRWSAFVGDAVTGGITEVAFWDTAEAMVRIASDGGLVDLGGWGGYANLAITPTLPDWLLMWAGHADCTQLADLRATHLDGGNVMDMTWSPAELVPPELLPEVSDGSINLWPWNLDAALDENGESVLLLGVSDAGCGTDVPSYDLIAWSPDDGPRWHAESAASSATWPPTASWAAHDGGAAFEVTGYYGPSQTWRVVDVDGVREEFLNDDPDIYWRRAGPMLDPAGPTFATVSRRLDYRDVIEIHHEGAVVWTIDALRFGLAEESTFFADVVLLPPLAD